MMLNVLLLGSPQLILDQHPLNMRRKNRALVYYLATSPEGFTRDHLLNVFWQDHDRTAAQQTLRTILHDVRKQLGTALVVDDDRLSLALDAAVDVRDFQARLSARPADIRTLSAALDLYHGDFLEDFTLADSPVFDDWAAAEREHYRSLMIRGLTWLSQLNESRGQYGAAVEALLRALAFDPLQEEIQRCCIRLHYLNGDRAAAVRRYDLLRKLLDEEMGVLPMAETRALYDAIITDSLPMPDRTAAPVSVVSQRPTQPLSSKTPFLPFTGRTSQLELLNNCTAAGKLLLIEGEPGIGKTRLAEEFIRVQDNHAALLPLLMMRGAAYELEQGLPYQPVIDALRDLLAHPDWADLRTRLTVPPLWLAEIARLLPELTTHFPDLGISTGPIQEARLWEALRQFFLALVRLRRMVIFLDDLQWADRSTLGFLAYLVRRAASDSLIVLGTTHPIHAGSPLAVLAQTLTHEDRLIRVPLSGLTRTEMGALAQHFSRSDSQRFADWLMPYTEGNPYFVTELLRRASEDGLLDADGLTSLTLPQTIQNLIQSRLARLSENARRLLELAAVMGYEFDFEIIAHAVTLSESAVLDALDELQAANLLQSRGAGRYGFDHSLTMEVVYRDMGEPRARRLHRQAADALEGVYPKGLDAIAGMIAYHLVKSSLPARAAPYAYRAGQHAATLAAWTEAIAFYEQTLDTSQDANLYTAVLIGMGEVYYQQGDFKRASEILETAIQRGHPDFVILEAAYEFWVQSIMPQSRFTEATAFIEKLYRLGPPELALCAEFIWGTLLSVESERPIEAEQHLKQAEKLFAQPRAFTSRITLAKLKYQLGGVMGQQGRYSEAVALYRAALALVRDNETVLDLQRRILLYNNLAYYLLLLGDADAADYADAGLKLARDKASLAHQPYLLSTAGEIALARQDLDSAERCFVEGLALAEQLPMPERIAGLTANLGRIAAERGQTDLAKAQLSTALAQAEHLGRGHLAARIRMWLVPLISPAEARQHLAEARTTAEGGGYHSLLDEIARLEAQFASS